MLQGMNKILFVTLLSGIGLALLGTIPATAQIPTPKAVAPQAQEEAQTPSVAKPERIAPFSPTGAAPVEPIPESIEPQLSPEAERLTQEERQAERAKDKATKGYDWMPWTDAGEKTWNFVLERDPAAKEFIRGGYHIDVAVADVDRDKEPDVIVYYWNDANCGAHGCLYTIYFGDKSKKQMNFITHELRPTSKGVKLDDKRYSF